MYFGPESSKRFRKIFTNRLIEVHIPDNLLLAKAFRTVDRAAFIPESCRALRTLAYRDQVIPLQEGASMSQPSLVAKMLKNLHLEKGQKVLEIGSASGYQAALLAEIVGPRGGVHTIEINHELAEHAKKAVKKYPNVTVHESDGTFGLPEIGPFDRIIVSAQGIEVPLALREQLVVGGFLIMPVGEPNKPQHLIVLQKLPNDAWYAETISNDVFFVPMRQSQTRRTTELTVQLEIGESPRKILPDKHGHLRLFRNLTRRNREKPNT